MTKFIKFGLIGLSTFLAIMILTVPNLTLSYGESWCVAGIFFSITTLISLDMLIDRFLELKEGREHYEKKIAEMEENSYSEPVNK